MGQLAHQEGPRAPETAAPRNPFELTASTSSPVLNWTIRLTKGFVERACQLEELGRLYRELHQRVDSRPIPQRMLDLLKIGRMISMVQDESAGCEALVGAAH